MFPLPFLTNRELGAAYDSGELSPMEATHGMLDRIEQFERRPEPVEGGMRTAYLAHASTGSA